MNYNEFAKEVHVNAVNHGWWDENRSAGEIIALCHSEISEALEEFRAGRPNAYVVHADGNTEGHIIKCHIIVKLFNFLGKCVFGDHHAKIKHETDVSKWGKKDKPEGIAVELADAVIRCFDWFGKLGFDVAELLKEAKESKWRKNHLLDYGKLNFGEFVSELHLALSLAYQSWCNASGVRNTALHMAVCCTMILDWAERENVDIAQIMRIKHEYNKTRPYKHNKVM